MELEDLVCDPCTEENLAGPVGLRSCFRCKKPYCIHFASKIDPLIFCINCFTDVSVSISPPEVQVIEHYNAKTDTATRYERRPKGKRIQITGKDWLFAERIAGELNEAELEMFIYVHQAYVGLLLNELEFKKLEKAHKAASVKIQTAPSSISTTTKTETTVKKTTVAKMDKTKEQAEALLKQMFKGKISLKDIEAFMKGKETAK